MPELADCRRCGRCCRYVTVRMPTPRTRENYSDFLWFLLHRDVNVFIDEDGDWFLEFVSDCTALDGDRCTIHSSRPLVCREHSPGDCEYLDEQAYDVIFRTPEELERYLDEMGIEFRFKD